MPGVASNTKWKCSVCGSIFDFLDETRVEPCTKCGATAYDKISVTRVCDFCAVSESSGWWEFPCEDFAHEQVDARHLERSAGSWVACQDCCELIQADDRVGLAKRCALSHEANSAIPTGSGNYHLLFATARRTHKGFFEHRNGEPRKMDAAGSTR